MQFDFWQEQPEEIQVEKVEFKQTDPVAIIEKPVLTAEDARVLLKEQFADKIQDMSDQALAVTVTSDETERQAITMAGQVKKLDKALDDKRKEIISEPDKFVRDVNALVRSMRSKITPIEQHLRKKIDDYKWKKEIARREREKIAQEEARRLEEQLKKEAEAKGVIVPIQVVIPVEKKQTVVHTESGTSAHLRTEWKMTAILDFSLIPDEYKMLDEKKVNASIRAGIREIPGLEIKEVPRTVLRI